MTRRKIRFERPRRDFLKQAALGGLAFTSGIGGILYSRRAPAVVPADGARPEASWGLQIGDVTGDRAIVWSRADTPSRLSSRLRARPPYNRSRWEWDDE